MDPGRPFVDSSPSNGILKAKTPKPSAPGSSGSAVQHGDDHDMPLTKRWGDPNDPQYGDVHFYDYVSNCLDPETYPKARMISEFGFQVGFMDMSLSCCIRW